MLFSLAFTLPDIVLYSLATCSKEDFNALACALSSPYTLTAFLYCAVNSFFFAANLVNSDWLLDKAVLFLVNPSW